MEKYVLKNQSVPLWKTIMLHDNQSVFIAIAAKVPYYVLLVEKLHKLGIIFSFKQYPLGITDFNEASTEDIIGIMQHQHQFVPGHDSDLLARIFSVEDLLTVERQQNAQDDLIDSASPSAQLEGLIFGSAELHSYEHFKEVSSDLHISK